MTPAPQADRIGSTLDDKREDALVRFGLGLANWSERWFPDPLVFAFVGIVVVFIAGLLLRESPSKLAIAGGKSFWSLVPFTMTAVRALSAEGADQYAISTDQTMASSSNSPPVRWKRAASRASG